MTEPEVTQAVPENASPEAPASDQAPAPEAEAEPPPEPWTPERVSEWNAYYDVYVMAAALLLVFIVSCNYVAGPRIFADLKAGQLIHAHSGPVLTDEFSYTEAGQRWVDVPWLFQWACAALYNFVYGLVPTDPTDPTANRGRADQIAIGTLVVLDALIRLATAWVLLKIRHRGPGLWWSAVCVTLAFGVVYHPLFGILMGGIAGVPTLGPATWGLFFMALELLIVFRAFGQGRGGSLWLLIPLFLLWANCDVSFLTGLVVLAAAVIGRALDGQSADWLVAAPPKAAGSAETNGEPAGAGPRPAPAATGFLVLGVCAAVCLVNPWTYRAYLAAVSPFLRLFQPATDFLAIDELSFFGSGIREQRIDGQILTEWYLLPAYYFILVFLGLASFLLNAARFSWSRFVPFAALAVLWGIMMRFGAEFAMVWAVVLALNGQEWYQSRFGTEGRLGRTWTVWSTGGRLVTLALLFLLVSKDITGWRNTTPGLRFGLGYDLDDFPFEAAEFLEKHNEIQGNILNTSMGQGDILIWKAFPKRKTYVDTRVSLFPRDRLEQWHKMRKALSEDDEPTWKPLLDEYGISVVMIEPVASSRTYTALMTSPHWIPFYDDGRIVLFGRADAPASDLAFFKANRLDPEQIAYHKPHPVPAVEGPPSATSWIDEIFQNRTYNRTQRRNESAQRWLAGPGSGADMGIPDPARCILAIQDARIALSRSPDDWIAFRVLDQAYKFLTLQEAALLAGIPLTAENQQRISTLSPSPELLLSRYRQRATVLNYAIQTTPPVRTKEARQALLSLNLELFQVYMAFNAGDLARDRLQAALDLAGSDDLVPPEVKAQLQQQHDQLQDAINKIQDQMEDMALESQAGPLEQGELARQRGAAGLAIAKFAEAERSGISLAAVKPRLIDLYCVTGQPDKALDLLSVGAVDDPNLGTEPGTAAYRQGLVHYLLGNYLSTASLWQERAIPRLRFDRSERVLGASRALTHGDAIPASNYFLALPGTLGQQATWEYDLAICQLEAGMPEEAAKHFTQALTLDPNLPVRPIAAYYLERMGKPVPPPSPREGATGGKPTTTATPAESITKPVVPAPLPQPTPRPEPSATAPKPPASQEKAASPKPDKPPASEKTRATETPSKKPS